MTTSLNLLSADVDHSFWVPALFGKIDSIPNQVNHMWFNPDKAGMYVGQCAQFCGVEHAKMLLRVYVQTPEDFAAWVKNQQQPAVQDPAVAEGRQIFESQACSQLPCDPWHRRQRTVWARPYPLHEPGYSGFGSGRQYPCESQALDSGSGLRQAGKPDAGDAIE